MTHTLADVIDQLTMMRIEAQRCMAKFQEETNREEKHRWWQASKECLEEITSLKKQINELQSNKPDDAEVIYATCQDCGQILTREAYALHNADHSVSIHRK